ncbi:MAG: AmmeMemoRadiSam system radical SAM enzyme, partial [Armatimonadetes bacterium]|nr:AmmeMemoRadiSam system radical SAM enzyme [Armatimonadota bacterium]
PASARAKRSTPSSPRWGRSKGQRGVCGVRENRGGTYYTLVYGWAAALNIDPIEKKPLFHYLPGSKAFSIGTAGCNLSCKDCQNWQISQVAPEEITNPVSLPPATAAAQAVSYGAKVLAYTYNEPTIFYEYMYDTARAGRERGLRSVMISSGFINREPLLQLAPHLDAIKIDLKGFDEQFYLQYCGGSLEPVKQTIKRVKALGKWLEIVCLIVPTINDDTDSVRRMSEWILRAVGDEVPVHFTRFMPAYRLKHLPPTPIPTLERCWKTAREAGLKYVYIGNAPGHDAENTVCAGCGKVVIRRYGYQILEMHVKPNGACRFCGTKIPGVWA